MATSPTPRSTATGPPAATARRGRSGTAAMTTTTANTWPANDGRRKLTGDGFGTRCRGNHVPRHRECDPLGVAGQPPGTVSSAHAMSEMPAEGQRRRTMRRPERGRRRSDTDISANGKKAGQAGASAMARWAVIFRTTRTPGHLRADDEQRQQRRRPTRRTGFGVGHGWAFQMPPNPATAPGVPTHLRTCRERPGTCGIGDARAQPNAVATSHGSTRRGRSHRDAAIPPRPRDERHADAGNAPVSVSPTNAIAVARHHGLPLSRPAQSPATTPWPAPATTALNGARRRTGSTTAWSPPRSARAREPAAPTRRRGTADGQRPSMSNRMTMPASVKPPDNANSTSCSARVLTHRAPHTVNAGCGGTTMSAASASPETRKATALPRRARTSTDDDQLAASLGLPHEPRRLARA